MQAPLWRQTVLALHNFNLVEAAPSRHGLIRSGVKQRAHCTRSGGMMLLLQR